MVHFGPAGVGHFRPASYGHFNPARVVYYVRRFQYNTGIFVLKDDLNIRESLDQDLLERNDLKSEKQEIQNILRLSLNNNRFEKGKFQIEVEDFHLLSSTIPIVCDDEHPDGLFIVIGRDLKSIPNDTEEIFRIFNRVLANWISKYNECVYSRISKKE